MKLFFLAALFLFSSAVFAQQEFTGIMSDNLVSSGQASYNPSTIVDSKTKFSVSTSMDISSISNFAARNFVPYGLHSKYYDTKNAGYLKRYLDVHLVNLKYEFDHANAMAYSFRIRSFATTLGIPTSFSKDAVYEYKSNDMNPVDLTGLSYANLTFTEHAFTYARTIFDHQTSSLKAGATIKILNGLDARYLSISSGSMSFIDPNYSSTQVSNLNASFGKNYTNNQETYRNRGLGFDLGFTYEYRPNFEEQYYEMDGAKRNVRYDIDKYKWKISASVTDIGWMRFMRDTNNYYNFSNSTTGADAGSFINVNSIYHTPYSFAQNFLQTNGTKSGAQASKFRMNLPTSMHVAFDMNIARYFFVSYNVSLPLVFKSDPTTIKSYFIHTVTPRIEKSKWAVMLPLSQMGNGKLYAGFAGRFRMKGVTVFVGSNNLSLFYGQKASLSRNFFAGISYNVLYKVPNDRDGDKISDEKDACPDDPGLPEFHGCPDTDGDGIPDKEDLCIYDKGPRKTHGCPDTDGDGIIDMNDMCPDEKGLGIHYGCPDRDMDGVIDAADRCPDVPGVELNNGCPLENQGCCNDTDGDGILNDKDKCPEVPGSVYNSGCPIDKDNIDKINLQQQKEQKDANNTGQQAKQNPEIDPRKQLITSQSSLDSLLANKQVIKNLSIYFDVDEASLRDGERDKIDKLMKSLPKNERFEIILIGYTDRDGSLDYNLELSRRRAETVQRKLIDIYKFQSDNIKVYYYGETKSIHAGDYTAEQKQADRRVDIKVIRLPRLQK